MEMRNKEKVAVLYVILAASVFVIILIILFLKATTGPEKMQENEIQSKSSQGKGHGADGDSRKRSPKIDEGAPSTIKKTQRATSSTIPANNEIVQATEKSRKSQNNHSSSVTVRAFTKNERVWWSIAVREVRKMIKKREKSQFQKPGTPGAAIIESKGMHLVKGYFIAPDNNGNMLKTFFACPVGKDERGHLTTGMPRMASTPF